MIEAVHYGFEAVTEQRLQEIIAHIVIVDAQLWDNDKPLRAWAEIQSWLLDRSCGPVMHEIFARKHRLYFTNPDIARDFKQDLPQLLAPKGWFFHAVHTHPMEDNESIELAAVLRYTLPMGYSGPAFDMWRWTRDHLVGRIWYVERAGRIIFEKMEDFVAFKLRYVGESDA